MSGYWDTAGSDSRADQERWAEAERAAELLRQALRYLNLSAAEVATPRAVRDVVGRPVVQLGTMPPEVAQLLAERLRAGPRVRPHLHGRPEAS